jgi:hypothetical protein
VGSSLRRLARAHVCRAGPHGPHVFDLPWPLLTKEGMRGHGSRHAEDARSFSYPQETRKRLFIWNER